MKNFKRGFCQICVLACCLGLMLLLGSIFEGMMAPFTAVGGGLFLLFGTDALCGLLLAEPAKPVTSLGRKAAPVRFETLATARPGYHPAA